MESTDEVGNLKYQLVVFDKSWGGWVDLEAKDEVRRWFEDVNKKVVDMIGCGFKGEKLR